MADWSRVIGALRRLHGSDLAERAGRIAEAAPEADRQFTQSALTDVLRGPNVGVGPGSAYSRYYPIHNPDDLFLEGGITSGENVSRLRRLLDNPRFRGYDEVPWMNYDNAGDRLLLSNQEGRHRSMAIGDDPTVVGISPYRFGNPASLAEIRRLPVYEGMFNGASRMPALGQSYQLFDRGGAVRRFAEGGGTNAGPDDEAQFLDWARGLPWHAEFTQEHGGPPDLDDPDYSYRQAFRAGIAPERYLDGRYHWPSVTATGEELKSPTHPTYWMEEFMRLHGRDPNEMDGPFMQGIR
jgi:hypothetical protein